MEKRTPSVMYCNNCGGKGHLFRTCKDPVLSCGIILLNHPVLPVDGKNVQVLMIRRKDSMSFAEFMRGKYDPTDLTYIGTLLQNMTLKEQALVASEPFETVWKTLWGDDRNSSDFPISKEKYNQLDRVNLVFGNRSVYVEPEWGFPKGRRMRGETDLMCALREFNEETNVPRDAFVVLKNISFEETFVGLNGVRYRHVYFIGLLKDPSLINLGQKFTPMQRREISGIAWKTFEEINSLIRPHHVQRRVMLERVRSAIETFESN